MKDQDSIPSGTRGAAKNIIITGDDFGLALPVNEAIVEAHRTGVLTTASLMVGEPYFQDAVARARQNPSLRVGLHLALVEGRPLSDPREIPDLVDSDGSFSTRLARAGFRFFFRPGVRRQLETEIRAQFGAFQRTGLALDHVNAHNHMHLHPTVLGLMIHVGKDFGLRAVRFPCEPPIRSWKASRKALGPKLVSSAFLFPWMRLMKHRLRRSRIRHNDWFFGMADSGSMTLDLVLRIVSNLPEGVTELGFHPATGRCPEIDSTMPRYRHEDEYRALISQSLRRAAEAWNVHRIAFSDL